MSSRVSAWPWIALVVGAASALWLLRPILLPFVLGMAIGYLLDPLVTALARRGVGRGLAAGGIVVGSYLVGVGTVLLVVPVVVQQAAGLASRVPAWLGALHGWAAPALVAAGIATPADLRTSLIAAAQRLAGPLVDLVGGLVGQGLALVNLVGLLAITPLVAFYLLRDWPRVVAEVDGWLPRRHAETIRAQARAIDAVLAGFARGTALSCVVLAGFYALGFSALGLDFGVLVGLAAGLVSFLPYVGAAVGFGGAVTLALVQHWPGWGHAVAAAVIAVAGQVLQDWVLTPRLVGDQVGLHPLWVVFAVLAGGTLFGVVGMLLAIPAASAIGVLVRFGVGRYKASGLYRGDVAP